MDGNGKTIKNGIPLIPKCRSITFDTGNILTWSRLKKRPLLPGPEEALDGIGCLARNWMSQQHDHKPLQYSEHLQIHCQKQRELILQPVEAEREELRIFVKLIVWLNVYRRGDVRDAVQRALDSLAAKDCDGVVLSLAAAKPPVLEDVKPLWAELEELHASDVVGSLGVADFAPELLEELYEWATEKPRICQVYEKFVCSAPSSLRDFATANGMQLLSHSDQPDPLPVGRLSEVLGSAFGAADSVGWRPNWLARVTASYRHRGVVSSWGFLAKVDRGRT